jgi:hypothetical protein
LTDDFVRVWEGISRTNGAPPCPAAPLQPQRPPWLGPHLCEAAAAFLGARYHRLRSRRGSLKANEAVAHSIDVTVFYMLRVGAAFSDLGADVFGRRRLEHRARQLINQLNRPVTPSS